MSIEKIVHRIASDASFAESFRHDPLVALETEGVQVSLEELKALHQAVHSSDQLSGVNTGPIDWYVSQFADENTGPIDWYVTQFTPKGA